MSCTSFASKKRLHKQDVVCSPPADIGSRVFSNILIIVLKAGGSGVPGAGGLKKIN